MIRYIGKHIFDYDAIFRQNVGIGTDTPSEKLHVDGNITLGNNKKITFRDSAGSAFTSIDYTSNTLFKIVQANSGELRLSTGFNDNANNKITFYTQGSSERVRITNDGNVLIGTATDNNSRLRILGATSDTTKSALEIRDSSASALFTVRNDGRIDVSGNLIIGGDLTVSGTTTTINTANLNVEDKNITINYSTGDSTSTADGAGITIQDAVDSSTDATILWDATTDRFDFSNDIQLPDNKILNLGSGSSDLQLLHDGSNSHVVNYTGDLKITNNANDKDIIFNCDDGTGGNTAYITLDGSVTTTKFSKNTLYEDNVRAQFGTGADANIRHDGTDTYIGNSTGHFYIQQAADDKDLVFQCDDGSGGLTAYLTLDGSAETVEVSKATNVASTLTANTFKLALQGGSVAPEIHRNSSTGGVIVKTNSAVANSNNLLELKNSSTDVFTVTGSGNATFTGSLTVNTPSTSSGIYAQFINLKGFCTLAANYQFAEDLEDTKSPFEMALDYGSATISSSTEVNQSNLFRASGFHVPVACSVNAINMQLTCNNAGNVTIAVVEYRPSEAGTDQVDHPRTVYEEVVVASNDNNNKVKTVTVATADLDNTAIPAGSHIMIMAKGDDQSTGGKAFISAAIEIKW